ncbi:patched family protein, putative [Plasmodium knowlesi strain H]|uniref:Patched family protein, putative n=3 Tax=Plasmodium knowlesi TaxID=5850 RepID=A0A5K1UDM9_PLAKH|nr:Niemann-Pick type C1-related protein, putative [Plasmodium knowlesi strain H]OTN66366.1 putative Patched family protein [Plasmodium knowlesi]CAA9986327.1 Niemann-Pick type C1-related protein, putative [Plasmodium knowlesi strain H]SBO25568.1 patched family protein, putative [Plasmodium knowlesi strain H]SBO28311.1 patched family protein, putative [Plasmodium knowlesi strain H]VVS75801.1 Niemann-Pick type C1-related protein, putative [Plasmodium knowlesi strain H]|eukprot:XP_002257732.1 patched family protein, putative [Plasmodium knowlesi strain H]
MAFKKMAKGLKDLKQKSLDSFSNVLYDYAGFVYERPCKIIIVSLLGCLLLSMGFYYREHEKNIYKLYSISNSYACETNETINAFFHKSRKAFIMVESNCNLLKPHILKELKQFEDGTKEIKVDLTEINECGKDSEPPPVQTEASKEVYNILLKKQDVNANLDWKPNFKRLNFNFALNKLLGLKNKLTEYKNDDTKKGKQKKENGKDKKKGNDDDEDDDEDDDDDEEDDEEEDDKKEGENDTSESNPNGENNSGNTSSGDGNQVKGFQDKITNMVDEKIKWLKVQITNLMNGKTDVNTLQEKQMSNVNLSDFEGDTFFPPYYIPPMLLKGDRCQLQNVFKEKNLNINLREASEELKKQITFTMEDICEKKYNDCNLSSIFLYYEKGNAKYENPIKVDNLDFYVNRKTFKEMVLKGILGNMQYKEGPFSYTITSANAIMTVIPLLNSSTYEPYVLAYEKKLIDYVRSYNIDEVIKNEETNDGNEPFVKFHVFTERSLEDEVDRISKIDNLTRLLFIIGVCLIFLYALFNNVTSVLYRSKPLCAVMGILCGFLGYLAGSGFLFFLGVKSVPPAETVPFLVIGVGVDDVFVILNSYSLLFMIKDNKKRIQLCLKDSALAITVTTLTNIIAFLISSVSPFYSICSFSLFTASSLFFGYLMVLTLLLSFLCIEGKLEKKKRNVFSGTALLFCSFFRKGKNKGKGVTPSGSCAALPNAPTTQSGTGASAPRGDATGTPEQNNLSLDVSQNEEDYKKTPPEYENISIYEWIHNLYLFEESFNKKKKNATVYSSNEISSKGCNNENGMQTYLTSHDRLTLENVGLDNKDMKKRKGGAAMNETSGKSRNDHMALNYYTSAMAEGGVTPMEDEEEQPSSSSTPPMGQDILEVEEGQVLRTKGEKKITIVNDIFASPSGTPTDTPNANDLDDNVADTGVMRGGATTARLGFPRERKNLLQDREKGLLCGDYGDHHHYNNSTEMATKDTLLLSNLHDTDKKNIYLLSSHDNALFYKYIYEEPKGNIGKYFRSLVKNYYVPFLSSSVGKAIVYVIFSFILMLSIYGCTLMKKGIKYDKAFPVDSYVRLFSEAKTKYFPHYGDMIEVYYFDKDFINKYRQLNNQVDVVSSSFLYSDRTDREMMKNPKLNRNIHWEVKDLQNEILEMNDEIEEQDFVSGVANGFTLFLNSNSKKLKNETPEQFYDTFVDWIQYDFVGNLFKNDFIFLNRKLIAWRYFYFQTNVDDSEISSKWLKTCKKISKLDDHNVQLQCFHISSIFNETDEAIIEVTLINLGITIITILFATAYIIKGFNSCLIIALIIFLIDLCIFGFMCLCGITVNIISMVILVLSVGFSIDHTSHIVQAFTHSMGKTRDEKMKESLHLMIGPVLHSGLSTWFVISTLFFSNKDFTVIFFQTLSLVLFFSVTFSCMLLPVLLSSFGPL